MAMFHYCVRTNLYGVILTKFHLGTSYYRALVFGYSFFLMCWLNVVCTVATVDHTSTFVSNKFDQYLFVSCESTSIVVCLTTSEIVYFTFSHQNRCNKLYNSSCLFMLYFVLIITIKAICYMP